MEYKVISGDGHVDLRWLPHDLFTTNAPAKWKEQVPRVMDTPDGEKWFAEGKDLTKHPIGGGGAKVDPPKRGFAKRIDRMYDSGFYEGGPHPTTPELRMKDQTMDGVDAEVIYGILGVGRVFDSPELRRVVYEIYNNWMADFCKTNPQRFVGLACIPNDGPEVAAAELRRAADLGLKGVDFVVSSAALPIWHTDWDPLWAASQECGIPISFHTLGYAVRKPADEKMAADYYYQHRATSLTMFQIAGAEFLAGIVFSGALDRFPDMKFVLGECGVSWLPYILARMDDEYDDLFQHMNLSLKPSEYWRRQGYTTFQHERTFADIAHLVGEDNIIWGSDYPHGDGVWPDSMEIIEDDLGPLRDTMRRKITCENAGRLYGLI